MGLDPCFFLLKRSCLAIISHSHVQFLKTFRSTPICNDGWGISSGLSNIRI